MKTVGKVTIAQCKLYEVIDMMIKEKGLVLGRSILLLEEIRVPGEYPPTCRKSLTKFNICIEYTSS
jgi:hypothetical protein